MCWLLIFQAAFSLHVGFRQASCGAPAVAGPGESPHEQILLVIYDRDLEFMLPKERAINTVATLSIIVGYLTIAYIIFRRRKPLKRSLCVVLTLCVAVTFVWAVSGLSNPTGVLTLILQPTIIGLLLVIGVLSTRDDSA